MYQEISKDLLEFVRKLDNNFSSYQLALFESDLSNGKGIINFVVETTTPNGFLGELYAEYTGEKWLINIVFVSMFDSLIFTNGNFDMSQQLKRKYVARKKQLFKDGKIAYQSSGELGAV